MKKITVETLLKLDDKKETISELVDAGLLDSRCFVALILKDDFKVDIVTSGDMNVFEVLGMITVAEIYIENDIMEKI